jgi:hypothetical protein
MDNQDKSDITWQTAEWILRTNIRQGVKWIFRTKDIKKTTGLITFKGYQVQDMYLLLLKYKPERYTSVLRGSL